MPTSRHYAHLLLLVIALAVWGLSCQKERPERANAPLRIGMELAYPPFEMTDRNGTPTGVSVELAQALGKSLGRRTEIVNMAFDGLIPALKTGKIDLIISSMTATPERSRSIAFSEPYLQTGLCLLVRKGSLIRGASDLDRSGLVVVVKKGTTGHVWAVANLKQPKVLVLDKEATGVLEVVQGKADAFIYDQMSVYKNWQRHRETTAAILEPFQREGWAIGLRKDDVVLRGQVNQFLGEFRAAGGFARLGDTYLKEMKEEFRRLGYQFIW
jgi:polar amino acid transport system substrate-binding protein